MSSQSQRQATVVWLLTDALIGAGPALVGIAKASSRVRPYVLEVYDKTMRRVQKSLCAFVNEALETDETGTLSEEHTLAWLHMLTALVGDQWQECPAHPPERKRNWRRLNNAIAEYIEQSDPSGEIGVELGCRWAETVKEILRR